MFSQEDETSQMSKYASTRSKESDTSESSVRSNEILMQKIFLENNARCIALRLNVDLLMPNLPSYLPREEILRAKNEENNSEAAFKIIHSVMRNLGSGAFQQFISDIKESQPGLLQQVSDTLPSSSMDLQSDVSVHQLLWNDGSSESIIHIVTNPTGDDFMRDLRKFRPHELKVLNMKDFHVNDLHIPDIRKLLLLSPQNGVYDNGPLDSSKMSKIFLFISKIFDLKCLSLLSINFLDSCKSDFFNCLASKDQLFLLCINDCKITLEGWHNLTTGLKQLTGLRKLSLNNTNLLDSGATILWHGIAKHNHIEDISLDGNRIADQGFRGLLPLIHDESKLRKLSLAKNHISDHGAKELAKIDIKLTSLKELTLCENQIGNVGAECLIDTWPEDSGLLDLWHNQINKEWLMCELRRNVSLHGNKTGLNRARVIAQRMEKEQFTNLNLNATDMTDEGIQVLEKPICEQQCLEVLEIKDNYLTIGCWSSLMAIKAYCLGLKKIDIGGNEELHFATSDAMCIEEDQSSMLSKFFTQDALNFSGQSLTDQQLSKICQIMRKIPLKAINFRKCWIGDGGARVLIKGFNRQKFIIYQLDLSENGLTDKSISLFHSAFDRPNLAQRVAVRFSKSSDISVRSLLRLDLENNFIADQGITFFRDSPVLTSGLVYLSLKGNRIGDAGCKALAAMLKKLKSLRYLSLRQNKLGDAGAASIAKGLKKKSQLLEIDLGENNITSEGLEYIGDQLKENQHLQYLDVSNNDFSFSNGEGITGFCNGLARNKSLTKLIMSDVHLTFQGLTMLREVCLSSNKTLTHLNLVSNTFEHLELNEVGKLMKFTKTLIYLNISGNSAFGFYSTGMGILCDGIVNNNTLKFLGIREIGMEANAVKPLAMALSQNKNLVKVDVTGNNIERNAFLTLVRESGSPVEIIFDNIYGEDYLDQVLYTPFPYVPFKAS